MPSMTFATSPAMVSLEWFLRYASRFAISSSAAPSGSLRSALDTYDSGKLDDDCISAAIDALSGTKTVPYNGKNYDFTGFLFYANMPGKDRRGVVVIGGHGYAVWQFWDFSQEPPANAVDQ